ncbi:hypothetical protein SAMN05443575_2075 [Jatrophihabitans endophyticus]|uniref:Uncharacterized protein n=1 Tax=Jatrophihabitans endophyticus TaxID=1206085 RepID=A0A1M5K7B1_9ACTN|nr:hypothetical protein [Jatrophihabitans endophyticus]SHG48728.1 hypothetical protein SAMN05443575_2075 [Jatrophihabitans endophyticus]
MTRPAVALLALAALLAAGQWLYVRAAAHVDLHLVPAHARRRVRWLIVNSGRVQLVAGVLAAAAVGVQVAATAG